VAHDSWRTEAWRDYLEARGWVWAGPDGRPSKYRHETLTRSESGVIREVNLKKAIELQGMDSASRSLNGLMEDVDSLGTTPYLGLPRS
jgi:hypothetical protein